MAALDLERYDQALAQIDLMDSIIVLKSIEVELLGLQLDKSTDNTNRLSTALDNQIALTDKWLLLSRKHKQQRNVAVGVAVVVLVLAVSL